MTPVHAIMILIIRLWAAGVIIQSILGIFLWPLMVSGSSGDGDPYTVYTFINGGVWIVVGVLAWVFAPPLARRVFAGKDDGAVNINVSAETLVAIGGFLIGGFYIVEYAPTALADAIYFFYESNNPEAGALTEFRVYRLDQMIKTILVLIAACWLVFRPGDIARFFSKMRRAGLAKVTEDK